ncbi:MAG: type 1 glutamine amidotransferase, partial [Novipirellula sp. JB048]
TRLPPGAIRLASSERIENQAFRIEGKPIYCTQFHPELDRASLTERLYAYPSYVESISGEPIDSFVQDFDETTETNQLLSRFMQHLREEHLQS